MPESSKPVKRLSAIASALTSPVPSGSELPLYTPSAEDSKFPWNPDREAFPPLKHLPSIPGAPPNAAWVWGPDDGLGRLNLLTAKRILAAKEEIKTGEAIPVK
jgi:hypothetical protein